MRKLVVIVMLSSCMTLLCQDRTADVFGVTSFPNPFKEFCILRLHNLHKIKRPVSRLAVVNTMGEVVRDLLPDLKRAGNPSTYDVLFDAKDLAPGVYVLVSTEGGRTYSWKMLKVD